MKWYEFYECDPILLSTKNRCNRKQIPRPNEMVYYGFLFSPFQLSEIQAVHQFEQ